MEDDYEPQFSVGPSDVLRNAGEQPQQPAQQPAGYYPAQSMAYKQAGMNPLAGIAPLFAPAAERAKMASQAYGMGGGGQRQEPSPYQMDAEFYANKMGDLTAAQSLLGSKTGRNV